VSTNPSDNPEARHLLDGAAQLGLALTVDDASRLLSFLDLFYSWNAYAGFTSISRPEAVRLHLLDSLALVPYLAGADLAVDLGSGGGMPGLPLAICLPTVRFALVESRRRRCSFLREAIRQLDLGSSVDVFESDARRLGSMITEVADVVVARAFVGPEELCRIAHPLLKTSGRLVVMAGDREVSLPKGPTSLFALDSSRRFGLPGGTERRSIAVARRLG
jgi:16S rRNA (guanine527-N7)-methyltransferase